LGAVGRFIVHRGRAGVIVDVGDFVFVIRWGKRALAHEPGDFVFKRHGSLTALKTDAFEQPSQAICRPLVQVNLIWPRFTRHSEYGFHALQFNREGCNTADD
jgi:hypothetical protein